MPALHWWIGASSVSPYVITVAWGIASDIIIHHWSIAYELFTYWSLLSYFSAATVTITTKTQKYYFSYRYHYFHITLLLNTLLQILSYPGVVELTTQLLILENILWLPCVESINLGWILYPRKLLRSPILVGNQSIVTYYVLWSGNPEVTIIGTTPGDDRSLRSSCIHYVLILWSGTLLKGGLNIP